MDLLILFGQRKESYAGEYAPEPLACWSEYERDENPEGYAADIERKQAEAKVSGFISTRVVVVSVDQDAIRDYLVGHLHLKASRVRPG